MGTSSIVSVENCLHSGSDRHHLQSSAKKVIPRLRECYRQLGAEVVRNSSNKLNQTWGPPFSRALYVRARVRTLAATVVSEQVTGREMRRRRSEH